MADLILISEIILIIFFGFRAVLNKFGGPTEALWRLRGIPYFRHNHILNDGTVLSKIDKLEIVKEYSPGLPTTENIEAKTRLVANYRKRIEELEKATEKIPARTVEMFRYNNGLYLSGESGTHQTRYNSGIQMYYNPDDMEPIPMRHWNNPHPISPTLVDSAFNDHSLEEMHRYGQRPNHIVLVLIIGIFILACIAGYGAYEAHNAFCAVNPSACTSSLPTVR